MRVLFVTHLPWVRTLGSVRLQLELSETLAAMGVDVAHLAGEEIGFRSPSGRVRGLLHDPHPSSSAIRATRRRVADFDVVDGHQELLPVSASSLGLRGALVVRSAGTAMTHAAFERAERRSGHRGGHPLARPVRAVRERRTMARAVRSFTCADLAVVVNRDEADAVTRLRAGAATVQIPSGLPRAQLDELWRAAGTSSRRRSAKTVAFVGTWDRRKGAGDWPAIVRATWRRDPDVSFRFLGTRAADGAIAAALGVPVGDERIRHVPLFDPPDLPWHLADAAVLALPSYAEGYPIASIEAAAAGLPTVGYDTVGTREIPERLPGDWVVTPGDAEAMAAALVRAVDLDDAARDELARTCRALALEHAWEVLAPRTLRAYESVLGDRSP